MLKNKLKNGETSIGSWITLAHPAVAEIMANAGFDWLAVDLEHSVITIREAEELIRIINLSGKTPLVRLTSNDQNQIKRVMDAGSHGIIVPMVKSAQDALSAISYAKYPPAGIRGVGLARAQSYGASFGDYLEWQKDQSIIVLQIEHIEAVEKIHEIFSVDGIDAFIIGPYDLSCSMGIPGEFKNPEFLSAVDKINAAAKEFNIPSGIHVIEPEQDKLEDAVKKGYSFIAYSLDIRMLDSVCRSGTRWFEEMKK